MRTRLGPRLIFIVRRLMKRDIFRLLLFLLTLAAWPAFANQTGSQYTTIAGFQLGTVTLLQIEGKFGPAKLIETGEPGEYKASICYQTNGALLTFLSGEMGGTEHQLLGFAVSDRDATRACSKLPAKPRP